MTRKSIFKLFNPKRMGQTVIPRPVFMWVICVAMLSLFAMTAYAQEPTNDSGVEVSGVAVAPAVVTDKEPVSDSAYLAANPELAVAGRYAGVTTKWVVDELSGSIFLAANPELMLVHRYADALKNQGGQPGTYDIELLRSQLYAEAAEKKAEAAYLATNPELMVARRYTSVPMQE